MNNKTKALLPIAVLALGVALAVAIVKARPQVDRQPTTALPPLVRVMQVQPRDLELVVRSQGTVRPLVESTLVAEVGGRIDWISSTFAEGGFFNRGDKLVQIDQRDYALAVSQAEAQVAQAHVQLEFERAEAELAREEWRELGEGAGNPLALRQPQLAEAEAAVQAATAALEKARLDLERTAIRAQFGGRVRAKLVDLGQFISRGTPLAHVYSTDAAEIRLPVRMDELPYVGLDPGLRLAADGEGGPPVVLRASIGRTGYEWTGRIVRTGSEIDPSSRMLPLFARIDDPFRLSPGAVGEPMPVGLFVDAEIQGIARGEIYVLPRSAVRSGSRVLVVDPEGRLRYRAVEVLRNDRDRALIERGLAPDELVCISQIETVVDGMPVRTQLEEVEL